MSKLLIKCLCLVVWLVSLDCQSNQDRPKIITENGNIILEPAPNKNIVLRPNGPNSVILAGDINILNTKIPKSGEQYQLSTNENFDEVFTGPNSILRRLEKLESQNAGTASTYALYNITYLTRRVNRLFTRVTALQREVYQITKDACESNPCQKGGTCLNLASGFHCLCPPSWEGKNCDKDVNECRNFAGTDLGCQNGATCYNQPGTYECHCSPGWFGIHCTKREKDCSQGNFEMCGHGTCISTNSGKGFQCMCDQGWENYGTGVCMTDINECDTSRGSRCSVNPKVECINTPGSFRCGQCPPGYEGDGYTCSDIDECVTIPNGGCSAFVLCHNTIGSRICGPCPQGYQGDGITCNWKGSCNINRGGCHPSAQCVENMSIVQCICPFGMDGDGVGIHGCYISTNGNSSLSCENNPCGNHGQCNHLLMGYTCLCFPGYSGAHCDITIDPCSHNPCRNGGTCRTEDTLTGTGYRCECTAQYTGNTCEMKAKTCGGYLDSEEGSIVYPLTNTSYVHDARCAWVIHTIPNKVINVTFSKFNLEKEPECLYDFLQIHDGKTSSNHLIGRFCGNEFPKNGNIISSHNYLYFWFRSDSSVSKPGFALHWNSIDPVCGGEVNASTHGHISSPGSPGKYPPNRDCYWHLSTIPSKKISLHFFTLDIESHSNCSFDFIAIYDGSSVNDVLINRFCNSTQPQPILSSSSELMIHFHSDAYGSGYGFQISFAPAEGIPGCGGLYTLDRGEIVSPSYDGKYLNNLRCEYKISASPDSKIRIDFKSFELENSHRCAYDYLKIYDGPSTDSRLIAKLCGSSQFPSHAIISSSNNLFIIFRTDSSVNSGGFKINFETVCQKTLFGDSGIIKSPGYPFSYPANKECEYIIGTVPGKAIQLTFQDFSIEDSTYYNCRYDFVEVRDGPDKNSTLLGKFCGGLRLPPVQVSTHNFLYVRFNSDLSNPAHVNYRGFYANYTTIDTECGGIHRETTGIINHPSSESETYNRNQKCSWMLIAPEGMHIKLTWNRFELETKVSCLSDSLELFEIDSSNHNESLGKYCGSTSPPSLTSSTNRLLMQFKSDYNQQLAGFSVFYTFLDASKSCGGTYVKSHGFIYSPGWPKRYEPNRACSWTIKVPAGQQIALNISHFNLEQPYRNKCEMGDYLEIRNGILPTSSLIGKYCGTFKSKRIISLTNALYLHFHSDIYITGEGFKIEWTSTETGCGGTLTSSSGSITSPNYPEKYNGNEECFYRIVTNQGSRIRINFADLDLENTASCRDDYVEIFDGRDENSPSLGKNCVMSTKLINVQMTTNIAFIKFRSDFYISGKGFLLNYDTICQNNITGMYGIIESPDYPGNYPTNLNCLWTINVPKGNKINITFTHFDIHYHVYRPWGRWRLNRSNCDDDFLQLKELNEISFSTKYCGTTPPRIHSTNSNSLQIKFKSGPGFPTTGFRMEWVSFGCGGLIQKSFGRLGLDKTLTSAGEMECQWIIEGPLGRKVTIHFENVYMQESPNCTVDSIEIFNGNDVYSPLVSKFCHQIDDKIQTMQSTSNFMLVRYVKKSDLKHNHFNAHYNTYQVGCGGEILASSGYIYSPNYPNNYDNDLNCLWTITVPANHRIELNFMFFDLYDYGENEKCSDSLRIYESTRIYATTRITRENNYTSLICPGSHVPTILTRSNFLALQFVTDHFGTAKGFKVNFTMACGSIINATTDGYITNKGYLSDSNSSCLWLIIAPQLDQKITLTITHMAIPKTNTNATIKSCSGSFLRIYYGIDKDAPLVNEYCGSYTPTVVSRDHVITVELGTYGNQIEGEFSAHYSSLDNTCGGTLTSERGEIASPKYPDPYPPDSDCEWILGTSPGNRVYIIFESFNLDYSEDCNQDYVEVRENNSGGLLLGVYCGNTIPTNTSVASKLFIKFRSDKTGSNQGFVIQYGFLHGNDITGLEYGEIASPLYPHAYGAPGEYTWRIAVTTDTISITVARLEIHTRGETCTNSLTFYDGYDDDAPILENLCGVLRDNEKTIKTSSNTVFIKLSLDEFNTGSLFLIQWSKTSGKEVDNSVTDTPINCGLNTTQIVIPGNAIMFESPHYPKDYDDNLNCEWIFKATSGRHLEVIFPMFKLEERENCYADSISVYSSKTTTQWKPVKENICLKDDTTELNSTDTHMKIKFKTDGSVTAKGFRGFVSSKCGGVISGTSGVVKPSWYDWQNRIDHVIQCDWTVKVRPGREINARFLHFNITNENECVTSVVLRNGESSESPLLGSGKYCGYSHEVRNELVTSSNALFISFKTSSRQRTFKSFELWYEEKNIECGATSTLSLDKSWETISSPNYPSVPTPFSECNWVFTGPPGEILRVDFLERFDIDNRNSDCPAEYVELLDGASEISPLLGRFCKEKPSTVKTRNNLLFVKYSTQITEPRNGFKANISIDVCGGTIIANNGELSSPGYPHMKPLAYGTVCVWRLTGSPGYTFLLTAQDINLPDSESPCATKITIEEGIPENNTVTILKTFCGDRFLDHSRAFVETLTNNVTIKLHIGKSASYSQFSLVRGFRFTFNSSVPLCTGTITTPQGYLTTPGYPRDTATRYCHWRITAPDENRRITLELIDFDAQRQRIGMYSVDDGQTANIQTIANDDISPAIKVFESSGNSLIIYVWLDATRGSYHRFKAKFDSDKPALCGGSITGQSGNLISPVLDRSYICKWRYHTGSVNLTNTVVIKLNLNSSANSFRCHRMDPKLNIVSFTNGKKIKFNRNLCRDSETVYRVPSNAIDFVATKNKRDSLYFSLDWHIQPCGGLLIASENPVNVLNIPTNYNETLDCAWFISVPIGNRVEISVEGSFQSECSDEFITINQNAEENSLVIGDYCKNKMQDTPLTAAFSTLFVQYHSAPRNNTNLKLNVKLTKNQCGGQVMTYETTFTSPNYPKPYLENQECEWEIKTDLGSRISLYFTSRFAIEGQNGSCTKDAVILYDWKNDAYVEIARLCGRDRPPSYNSTSNKMKVLLRTNSEVNLEGFQASWTRICGGDYIATEKQQFLYSPDYPYSYRPRQSCVYKISGQERNILVKFLDFDLEGSYPECVNDNLTITGESTYDYYYSVYCGSELPPLLNYEKLTLEFKTDSYINRKGFKLSYWVTSCGGEIKAPTVLSSSPVDFYDTNLNCSWTIEAPQNKIVALKFIYFDLESSYSCYNDYLAIYDDLIINHDKRLALMCGNYDNSSSIVINSSNNTMLLQFVTDSSVHGKGFKVAVSFSYSESVGCGGHMNLTASTVLKSPFIGSKVVYDNFLDCVWTIIVPTDHIIKIQFASFHIAPCQDVNQTALGLNQCDCDFVEVKDGINPESMIINKYCGHTSPTDLVSSGNTMSVIFHTDGEVVSSGFEATLSVEESVCGQTTFVASSNTTIIQSPNYEKGPVPSGIHCVYHFIKDLDYENIHIHLKNLDIHPSTTNTNQCDGDKLTISRMGNLQNNTIGKDFIMNGDKALFFESAYLFEESETLAIPKIFILCGAKKSIDFYLTGKVVITLQTSPDSDLSTYKGFELEARRLSYCGRNYSEPYGRVRSNEYSYYTENEPKRNCYTLITAPENYTISAYFISILPTYYGDTINLEIFDGNTTSAKSLRKVDSYFDGTLVAFSTGRYLLLLNRVVEYGFISYDLTYVTSDRGPGCGGKLVNEMGKITSPSYPNIYRQKATCEWELETPMQTQLRLRFSTFDLNAVCDQVYLQLVNRKGEVFSTYCTEAPADYTSEDNYVKIVFVTTMNNGGTGWVAEFIGITPRSVAPADHVGIR